MHRKRNDAFKGIFGDGAQSFACPEFLSIIWVKMDWDIVDVYAYSSLPEPGKDLVSDAFRDLDDIKMIGMRYAFGF